MSSGRALKGGERWRADRPEVEIARAFYVDVLGGRQVWPPDAPPRRSLWFLVGGALIEVGPEVRSATTPIVLGPEGPGAAAARCWDASFTVRVLPAEGGTEQLSLVDPFGRQIDLVSRDYHTPAARCG